MILTKENFNLNSKLLINISFALFPICFIFGNFITNINFLLFCCLGIFLLKEKIFDKKFYLPIKIIFLFFIIILFSTALSFIESLYSGENYKSDFSRLIKSVLFFRFFIFLIIIYALIELDILSIKLFFISSAIFPLLISADVIFQYTFGINIIGMESFVHHNTSFFGDEMIAGGYVQNFSFFSIFFLIHFLKNSTNNFKIFLITLAICTLGMGILLSGNKMPFILFLFGLFLLLLFNNHLRKIILISYMIIFIVFGLIRSYDSMLRANYQSFFLNTEYFIGALFLKVKKKISAENQRKEKSKYEVNTDTDIRYVIQRPYEKLTFTAVEVWKFNKIFGGGIKSFRKNCVKIKKLGLCSNHPHNYYIEILTDLGILGIIITIIIGSMFIFFLFKNFIFFNRPNYRNFFLLATTISLFLEVFPIKSTGSIFTTSNATYIILLSGIILSYKKNYKE